MADSISQKSADNLEGPTGIPIQPGFSPIGLWGNSDNDIFMVGENGIILHYDGKSLTAMESGTEKRLNAVWGSSHNDTFAVGLTGTILHYDGERWTKMKSGTYQELHGIWGSSAHNVFAVGIKGMILHYDGQQWSKMQNDDRADLLAIWGASGSDIFAVGRSGTILHYDGQRWTRMHRGQGWLEAVYGSSGSNVFAVGATDTILHYDGQRWNKMESGLSPNPHGVWVSSDTEAFIVGYGGVILRYDGQQWSKMESNSSKLLRGIWGNSSRNIFAVGQGETILQYNGEQWTSLKKPPRKIGTYQMTWLEFSPDGKKLFGMAGKQILTWDLKSQQLLHITPGGLFAISDDSKTFLTRSADGFQGWDSKTGRQIALKNLKPKTYGRFARSWLKTDRKNMVFVINDALNVHHPITINVGREKNTSLNKALLSPYGYLILIVDFEEGGHDTTFGRVFDMQGKELFRFYAYRWGNPLVHISKCRPLFAVETGNNTITVHPLPKGTSQTIEYNHSYAGMARSYARIGPQADLTVALNYRWNSFRIIPHSIRNGIVSEPDPVLYATFHPDGQRIAASLKTGDINIYNLQTLELEITLKSE
jgi:WD40 repeat protein